MPHHESIERPQHLRQRRAPPKLRNRFSVDPIGHQRRADAVAGYVADEQVQMLFFERADQPEVAANRARRIEAGRHPQPAPHQRFGRKALLYASRQRQVLFNLFLALLELLIGFGKLLVRFPKLLLDELLLGDIGERHNPKPAAAGVFMRPRADNYGHPRAVLLGNRKLVAIVPNAFTLLDFLLEGGPLLGCVERMDVVPDEIFGSQPGHAEEAGIREDDAAAIVADEHTFIHRLQHRLHLLNPIGPLKVLTHPGASFPQRVGGNGYFTTSGSNPFTSVSRTRPWP